VLPATTAWLVRITTPFGSLISLILIEVGQLIRYCNKRLFLCGQMYLLIFDQAYLFLIKLFILLSTSSIISLNLFSWSLVKQKAI